MGCAALILNLGEELSVCLVSRICGSIGTPSATGPDVQLGLGPDPGGVLPAYRASGLHTRAYAGPGRLAELGGGFAHYGCLANMPPPCGLGPG